jgi:hypothetical protein
MLHRTGKLVMFPGVLVAALSTTALMSLAALPAAGATAASGQTISVDGTSAGRVFDGVGALSAGASSRLLIDTPAS